MAQFTGETLVRHILTTYPQSFSVFAAHGMCEHCKTDPPPLPLHHFAGKHGVALADLIDQLEAAVAFPAQSRES